MDVSIIIINYNTLKITQDCIESVVKHTEGVEYEIILVDNASTDGSKEFFEQDNRLRYIYSNENLGFGRANNIGINEAKGNYLFLLNSDTYLRNNAIKMLFDYAEKHKEERAIYGCYLTFPNGKLNKPYFNFPRFTLSDFKKPFPNFDVIKDDQAREVDAICGADMFVPKSVVKETGMFHPAYFMYGEECEWQLRMRKAGIKRIVIPGPQIVHLGGASADPKSKVVKVSDWTHFITLKLHMPLWKYYVARFYYVAVVGIKLVSHPNDKNIRNMFLSVLRPCKI